MNSSLRMLVAGAVLIGTAACSSEKQDVDTSRDSGVGSADTTAMPAPAPPPVASVSSWKVTEFGLGPLRAGMTTRDAVAMLQTAGVSATADSSKACHYLRWSGPAAVAVMLEHGVVGSVEIANPAITTQEGAKIGDAESQIQTLYPGRVTVRPHKYTKGHYLVVKPATATDSAFRIVFETDGNKVTKYRSGKQPQVNYVERCG